MSNMTNLNIRVDSSTKKQAEELFSDLGLSMSSAINVFLKQAISRNGMPFEVVRREDFYSNFNQKYLLRSIEQLEAGKGKAHDLISTDD